MNDLKHEDIFDSTFVQRAISKERDNSVAAILKDAGYEKKMKDAIKGLKDECVFDLDFCYSSRISDGYIDNDFSSELLNGFARSGKFHGDKRLILKDFCSFLDLRGFIYSIVFAEIGFNNPTNEFVYRATIKINLRY